MIQQPDEGRAAMDRDTPTLPYAATRKALAEAIADIDGLLPGSVVVRHMRCGKQRCACKADPPALHGPYIQWTRTVSGKTVTRFLTEAQLARYQPWFDNARRLKDLLGKLEAASLHALEQAEGQTKQVSDTATPATARRSRSPASPPANCYRPGRTVTPEVPREEPHPNQYMRWLWASEGG